MVKVQLEFDTEQKHGNAKLTIDGIETEFGKLSLLIDERFPYFYAEPPKKKDDNVSTSKTGIVTTIASKELVVDRE